MILILIVELIIFQLLVEATNQIQLSTVKRFKKISELRAEYHSIEENLWQHIDHIFSDSQAQDEKIINETTNNVLKSHQSIFYDYTFETNSYWRSYLLFGIENLRDQLSSINSTLDANYGFLYDTDGKRIIYDSMKIEQWTSETMFRHLTENIDGLFELSIQQKENIFQHIRNVSADKQKPIKFIMINKQ